MWSVIVTQLLTFALALLGALLGVIFGTWFIPGQRLNPRAWQWIIVLGLISIGAIVYLVAEARAIEHRIKVVGRRIRKEVDLGATLEYDYRNGAHPTTRTLKRPSRSGGTELIAISGASCPAAERTFGSAPA